jgi:hypothetical protein
MSKEELTYDLICLGLVIIICAVYFITAFMVS